MPHGGAAVGRPQGRGLSSGSSREAEAACDGCFGASVVEPGWQLERESEPAVQATCPPAGDTDVTIYGDRLPGLAL